MGSEWPVSATSSDDHQPSGRLVELRAVTREAGFDAAGAGESRVWMGTLGAAGGNVEVLCDGE